MKIKSSVKSGALNQYLSVLVEGFVDAPSPRHKGCDHSLYVPRFQNLRGKREAFLRGYGIQMAVHQPGERVVVDTEERKMKSFVLSLCLTLTLLSSAAFGITIGQVDNFQSGTTENWFSGGITGSTPATPPTVVLTGGPGGAGDAYLKVIAIGGAGPGSRLTVINADQWTGNLLSVSGISMDLINLGSNALSIRLLVEDPMFGPPADETISTVPVLLPVGSGWVHVFFPTSAASFTALMGDATTALSNATFFRITHAVAVGDSEPVVGSLGIDNITTVVPEPGAYLTGGLGLVALALMRRRQRVS